MLYTKKQYLLLGISFLFNALWTISTVTGWVILIIGIFTNDDE